MNKTIGIISDTHNLLRPEVMDIFKDVDLIIHAGDIGDPGIIKSLEKISDVEAIKGNIDKDKWAEKFPETHMFEFEGKWFYVIHNLNELDLDPKSAGIDVVISGHSHKPKIFSKDNVLYLNPGSAGRRRFKLPVTVALLKLNGELEAEIITIES